MEHRGVDGRSAVGTFPSRAVLEARRCVRKVGAERRDILGVRADSSL